MAVPRLVPPSGAYLESYIAACRETWDHAYSDYILHNPARVATWRETIFADYARQERGEGLPPGFVPSRTLWFVDGDMYLGTVNIRLRMTEALKNGGGTVGLILRTSMRGRHLGRPLIVAAVAAAREMVEGPIYLNTETAAGILDRLHADGNCPYTSRETCTCLIDGEFRSLVRFTY